jgi:hypothetical protein
VGTAAVLASASPFVLAAPAGAAVNSSTAAQSLTFVTFTGATVSCSLNGVSSRDTEGARRGFAENFTTITGGGFSPNCNAHQNIDASYRDSQGVTRSINSYANETDEASFGWDGAYSAVQVTHRARFLQCDGAQSATCSLTVNTAPK